TNAARDAALVQEQRSYDIMMLTRSLDASLARSEAALGRYVVNSDRRTGTIYYDEWRRAASHLRELEKLVARRSVQGPLVAELRRLLAAREKELAAAAAFANVGKGWYAIGMYNRAGESSNVAAIDETLNKISANE